MRPESPKYLEDVRDAAAFILEVTGDSDLAEYLDHRLLRQGVERNFEIIGEALNRLRRVDPATADRIGETHLASSPSATSSPTVTTPSTMRSSGI